MIYTYEPTGRDMVLTFAGEVLRMQHEIDCLKADRDHYKAMYERERESNDRSAKATRENIGVIFKAVLDPESVINVGHAAIVEKRSRSDAAKSS